MHNIIKTPNYLLIVDDSKIELGSWHTCTYPEYPLEARFTDESTKYDICKGCKNIVAHLPLNNAPTLEGIDLLPPLEVELKIPIRFNLEAKDTHIQNGVLVKSQWVGEYIY